MPERDNSSPNAAKRRSVPTPASGGAPPSDAAAGRGAGRAAAKYRTKRPPPLPPRKAHKIKRIKAQRALGWAVLDRDPTTVSGKGQLREPAKPKTKHSATSTTVVRREAQLIEAERQRAGVARARRDNPRVVAATPAATMGEAHSDPRWLLLLKVGKDELAGIWDGRLASCEPIVWRPATKSWAPLFEVPQIATLVSATVKQRQVNATAVARASAVPASPAPRRFRRSGTAPAAGHPTAVPVSAAPARRAPDVPPSDRELPHAGEARTQALRPSSLAEMAGAAATGPTARLALRSPYIPPPPRVPSVAARRAFEPPAMHPAFDDDSASATIPLHTFSSGESEWSPTAQRYEVDRDTRFRRGAHEVAPQAQHEAFAEVPEPSRAADSYAPQAHTIAPLPASSARRSGVIERAGWLLGGVAAALVITTFTSFGASLHHNVADWLGFDAAPHAAAALTLPSTKVDSGATKDESAQRKSSSKQEKALSHQSDDDSTLSVEELPLLGKGGKASDERSERRSEGSSKTESTAFGGKARGGKGSAKQQRAQRAATRASRSRADKARASGQRGGAPRNDVGFNAAAARRALASSAARAQFCAGERATGTVVVTFAPSGGAVRVSLANLNGEDVRKGCVVRAFRGARVSPFQGDAVTVQKSFRLR